MTLVVDASAAIHALLPGALRERTIAHLLADGDLYAPALVDTEVLSGLARLERTTAITPVEAETAVRAWRDLPLVRVGAEPMIGDIWSLRAAVRIADAHYVALARALRCAILTADERLARSPVADVDFVLVHGEP